MRAIIKPMESKQPEEKRTNTPYHCIYHNNNNKWWLNYVDIIRESVGQSVHSYILSFWDSFRIFFFFVFCCFIRVVEEEQEGNRRMAKVNLLYRQIGRITKDAPWPVERRTRIQSGARVLFESTFDLLYPFLFHVFSSLPQINLWCFRT